MGEDYTTVSGVLLGMFQNNAGGAWDNAKKSFEKGVVVNGETYYKGSDLHKASVTGDTVGDPFKDTSGPSMNILIKLMSIVSLVIAPALANMYGDKIIKERLEKIENLNSKMISGSDQKIEIIEESPVVLGAVNADGDFVYELGDLEKITLNSGQEINLGANSQLYNLYKKLKIKDASLVDKTAWFTIENLYFESGKSNLKASSESQLDNLIAIMKDFPDVKVKLGGYTDDTGDVEANKKLSLERADAAKLKMTESGIASDRIETEGYGQEHPVCEANNTPDCKAKNRRIDVRVTTL